jgi:uncharacterized protein YerC
MTHVSTRKLAPETDSLLNKLLSEVMEGLNDKETPLVLSSLFSDTEVEMFKKRLGIILLLELGATTEAVSNHIKTTPQTISRIKMQWKLTPPKAKNLLLRKIKAVYAQKDIRLSLETLLGKK